MQLNSFIYLCNTEVGCAVQLSTILFTGQTYSQLCQGTIGYKQFAVSACLLHTRNFIAIALFQAKMFRAGLLHATPTLFMD